MASEAVGKKWLAVAPHPLQGSTKAFLSYLKRALAVPPEIHLHSPNRRSLNRESNPQPSAYERVNRIQIKSMETLAKKQ